MTGTMTTASDPFSDASALLKAAGDQDFEGVRIVLDYCDNREVAQLLASTLAALCRHVRPGFLDDTCESLRELGQEDPAP